jgi:glycosyltransferase involved in cell wall biosynthesis
MPENGFVSFVVIAYNEAANIARTVAAITGLDALGECEIIIVDDGSRDATPDVAARIAALDSRVHPIRLGQNRGRGYARSVGVAATRGPLIAMVDADITLPADWLVRARAALRDHDAVGGVAVPDGDVGYLYKRFKLTPRVVSGTTTVTGNNGLYRRETFTVVGFDPTSREGEDIALNHAMRYHGLSVVTVTGLLVEHNEDKTLTTSLKWLFDSGRGATRQLLSYREVRPPDVAAGAFAAAMALGLLLAVRRRPLAGASIPSSLVLAASLQHVRSRFQTPRSHWRNVVPAVAVDSAMLVAYFTGRLVGLSLLWPGRSGRRCTHEASPMVSAADA